MNGDNMHRFIAALMRLGICFAIIFALLLLGIAALLIWHPDYVVSLIQYGGVIFCSISGLWVLGSVIIGVFSGKWKK